MLRLSPDKQSQEDELEIGKARFKVAALQASPTDLTSEFVRQHPWPTVLGTAALSLALGALVGGRRKVYVAADGTNGHAKAVHAAPPQPKASWMGPLITMGSNLLQAYITKQMSDAHEATATQATAQAAAMGNPPPNVG